MSDPVLALVLIIVFAIVLAMVRYFKTLSPDFSGPARNPVVSGLVAGVILRLLDLNGAGRIIATGTILTIAALYARLTGEESEPSDGMLLGALSGTAAAVPLIIDGADPLRVIASCVLAGATAGFGITFAVMHVADKGRQLAWDVVAAGAAIAAAWIPELAARSGADDRSIVIAALALVPILIVGTVLKQWPDIRAELRHEASLGFIDDGDVRSTAHPLLRLGRGSWASPGAHREFVRIATQIALRKRQQRNRPEEMARLYQLEIIKLRMQLQEMSRIDARSRAQLGNRATSP